ncbi:CMRF35-like molecule 7 isoform X2 [Gambusia affinis]|uniref:CMRF35-like molecule 7 isoform X2 n=1 Tax=Gambusia affinis TaxID=33528 RepID=UPI001CDC33A9|nr:CMRF35-like molecule 7 isoform X2 [Gambusia affinis]
MRKKGRALFLNRRLVRSGEVQQQQGTCVKVKAAAQTDFLHLDVWVKKTDRRPNHLEIMKRSLVFAVVLLLEGVFQIETMSVTGTVGGSVTITCSHSYATTNVKYFCKGACDGADIMIKSRPMQQEGKYSIKDNGNTFYVTISNLEMSDGGVYWCGIERVGVDTYSKVTLTVAEENPGSSLKMPDSSKMVYLGAGLGVAVLALATVLLLFFRLRKRDVSTSQALNPEENPTCQHNISHWGARFQDQRGSVGGSVL